MFLAVILVPAPASPSQPGLLKISYLYSLSDFSGPLPYSSVKLYSDDVHGEFYASASGNIRIFNNSGMEIYRFGSDPELGEIRDLSVDVSGGIYILSYDYSDSKAGPKFSIASCNYRGEVKGKVVLTGLPAGYPVFLPHYLFLRGEKFILVDRMRMLAVEVDRNGSFLKGYDLAGLIGVEEKDRPDTEIFGFYVDSDGGMYFTVPVHFRAYRIMPDGRVSSFGKAGSSPGKFGVVSGVAVDGAGNIFVSDKRRHVVMVFDRQFNFLQEFGGYGEMKDNFSYPDDLCLDRSGKVYVSQKMNRGISVFQVDGN